MALQLIQADVQLSNLYRWAGRRNPTARTLDEGYALHCLLTGCFGKKVLQPFRLMFTHGATTANLYAYSTLDVAAIEQSIIEFAEPEFSEVLSGFRTKTMPDNFKQGRELGFDLKIRPVRRGRRTDGTIGERDAFLAAALARPDEVLNREDIYTEWLRERMLQNGVTLAHSSTRMASFERRKAVRDSGTKKSIEGPEAVFHGNLTVDNPEQFSTLLARGLGRHCAYGFGMLLLRPPRKV